MDQNHSIATGYIFAPAEAAATPSTSDVSLVFLNDDNASPCTVTEGLLPLLEKASNRATTSTKAMIRVCSSSPSVSSLHHIQQKDTWSCGFRNLQMLLTSLLPLVTSEHSVFRSIAYTADYRAVPSLTELQSYLEQCWAAGYDPKGAAHFHHRMVGKRNVWIGAVEVAACLSFLGIDATVVQFLVCPASRRSIGRFCAAYFATEPEDQEGRCCCHTSMGIAQQMLQTPPFSVTVDALQASGTQHAAAPRLPLYLQWKGHSVTVVGVEWQRGGNPTHLLVFDPRKSGQSFRQALQQDAMQPFRIPLSQLYTKDTQIVVPSTASLSVADQQALRGPVDVLSAAETAVKNFLTQQRDGR